jgi:CRISPR/Cas system-associated endonuclease Cas3-HD
VIRTESQQVTRGFEMIYTTHDTGSFIRAFENAGRKDQFSREALTALYDYYEELGEDIELDVTGICCEWSEYESLEEAIEEYGSDYETLKDFQDNTQVIELDNGAFLMVGF